MFEVLFLRPGRAIVTFVSPLSQLECVPFHQLFSHLIVIVFFFFSDTTRQIINRFLEMLGYVTAEFAGC